MTKVSNARGLYWDSIHQTVSNARGLYWDSIHQTVSNARGLYWDSIHQTVSNARGLYWDSIHQMKFSIILKWQYIHDMVQYHQRNKHLRENIITKFDKYN